MLAVARRDLLTLARYRLSVMSLVFQPLYQTILPALLFGAAFAVAGRLPGLEAATGSEDLAGYVFLGGAIWGLVAVAFWTAAFSVRMEMQGGTLEPNLLTPSRFETVVLGKMCGGLVVLAGGQAALFAIGALFFGLRLGPASLQAVPALLLTLVAMTGFAYLATAVVLLLREANFFADSVSYLFGLFSGVTFPVTLLPGALQVISFALPTTYAVDILRASAIGTRPLLDPGLAHLMLAAIAVLAVWLGRRAFGAADRRIRDTGGLSQY